MRANGAHRMTKVSKQSRPAIIARSISQRRPSRRGFSMVIVMLAIGFALALTYGFMRTQVTSLQLTQNEVRRDLALEAARTGISAGLLRMQDPAWVGVSDIYSKVTQQDSANLVSCYVTVNTVTSGQVPGVSDAELPLHLCLTSTGTWTSPRDSSVTVKRTIKAVVRLVPRLPGRTVRAGDVSPATDLTKNPTNVQATLPYTLTATGNSSTSFNFDPGTRIEGPIWLNKKIVLFNSENWSSTIRGAMLAETGNQYGAASPTSFIHPHPLNGPIRFSTSPTSSIQTDLGKLKTSWSTTTETPSAPTVNIANWQTYRLYDRGPSYQATTLSSSLTSTTLRPSATNPLGIFVRSGNLDIYDQVTIQGTVIVSGTVTFWGQGSTICAYNWISSSGTAVIADADTWPRLPAVICKTLSFSDSARQVIEGAVLVDGQMSGAGGDFSYSTSNWVNLTGTATASRGQQPYSTVTLQGSPDLSSIGGGQDYAIWMANGTTGRWYQIDSVDAANRSLTVIGEATISSPVAYRIRPNRSNFISMHGPVVAGNINMGSESMWGVASTIWTNTYSDWNYTNSLLVAQGKAKITFPDWVSNPANLTNQGWFVPWRTAIYGLQLEPTFSIQPTPNVNYLAVTPLFMPYSSGGTDASASGYRWMIVDWREDI
jgi:Tfp pilus assembly protein PilX